MTPLQRRIIDISYKLKLSHIGSCLTAVDIIDQIYKIKKEDEPFILSNGHAGLALYCVIEKYGGKNAESIYAHHGTHPDRCFDCGLSVSTGSLGNGLPIGLGMALSNRQKNVYVLTSDGEWAEGSMWEALRIAGEQKVKNLHVFVNANGFSALGEVDSDRLAWRIGAFVKDGAPNISVIKTEMDMGAIKGLDAHYHVLTDKEYDQLTEEEFRCDAK